MSTSFLDKKLDEKYEMKWFNIRQQQLKEILEDKFKTDVTFIVGKEEIEYSCHRILIASLSPVFKAMLYGPMQESLDSAIIRIPDIDSQAFECILQYSYCNNPNITIKNVMKVKAICDKYQIKGASEECDDVIYRELNSEHVIDILAMALEYKLESAVIEQSLQNIKQTEALSAGLLNSTLFLALDFPIIKYLLQINAWQVSEEILFEGVCNWAKYQTEEALKNNTTVEEKKEEKEEKKEEEEIKKRQIYEQFDFKNELFMTLLQELKKYIRFPCMNDKYFVKQIIPTELLTPEEQLSVFKYWHSPDMGCKFFNTTCRTSNISIIVNRGTNITDGWSYNGQNDALGFKVNQCIILHGIGLWCAAGSNVVSVKVFEGANDGTSAPIIETPQKTYLLSAEESSTITRKPIKHLFQTYIKIKSNVRYTIEIQQTSIQQCPYTSSGMIRVVADEISFEFYDATSSPNGTGSNSGAIPCLYFAKCS